MPHKTFAVALATAAASLAAPAVPALADDGPAYAHGGHRPASHLVITVTGSGDETTDGTFELYCDPAHGRHPEPSEACAAIRDAEHEAGGASPFAPVSSDALCTYMYGGPAVAEVEGTWRGQPVNARFDRSNGCEIARWDSLVPALPRIGGDRA